MCENKSQQSSLAELRRISAADVVVGAKKASQNTFSSFLGAI